MSSGDGRQGTDFALGYSQQPIRLIELPPTLLAEVVERRSPLQLKSIGGDAAGSAVLCSSSQTFSVRQNQSSNSLFLTENAVRHGGDDASGQVVFIKAVAQPKGMLEISPSTPDAAGHMKAVLPVLDKDTLHSSSQENALKAGVPLLSRAEQTRAAPFSSGEFLEASERACAFESKGVFWKPSPGLALEAWKVIRLQSPSPEGADLTTTLDIDNLLSENDNEGYPSGLLRAVLQRVGSVKGNVATMDAGKCVAWVGDQILLSSTDGMEEDAFLAKWEDLLPSTWRDQVLLEKLTVPHAVSEGRIGPTASTLSVGKVLPKASTRPLSKWHEKLMASRK